MIKFLLRYTGIGATVGFVNCYTLKTYNDLSPNEKTQLLKESTYKGALVGGGIGVGVGCLSVLLYAATAAI